MAIPVLESTVFRHRISFGLWDGFHSFCQTHQKKLPQTGKAILHFRPEGMKAGDVIPFFWKGSYHLFYLEGPDWGHIVSQDLLHWQELPKALVKGADPKGQTGKVSGPEVLSNITAHSFFSTPVRTAMIRSETKRSCRPEVLI